MNVKLSDDAESDLTEGFWFYERQSVGLGRHFRRCMIADIETLSTNAGIHAKTFGYHRLLCKKFPFVVYYEVESDCALVVAVLDGRRSPAWTRKRLTSP